MSGSSPPRRSPQVADEHGLRDLRGLAYVFGERVERDAVASALGALDELLGCERETF
jgi:hypothetical protein